MNPDNKTDSQLTSKSFVDSMIRVGLIAILAFLCALVFSPFVAVMVGGLILAVMMYPLHQRFARRLGGKQGLTATLLVLIGCLLLVGPLVMLGASFAGDIMDWKTAYENSQLSIRPPGPGVAEWPLVGERIYHAWNEAATDLPKFLENRAQQLRDLSSAVFSAAGSAIGTAFLFLGALIVAGIMMAFGESGSNAMQRILSRVTGPVKGPQLQALIVATIRSVATGVLGVALIQALLFGIGFLLAGIPAAGILALLTMFIGILQLPALIIALPAIVYLWAAGDASTTANILYTVYFLIAGLADNVLKPLLLGRGVEAPMPVILIGALGGMVVGGFQGLFLGAILLAVGYRIFMDWVDDPDYRTSASSAQADPAGEAAPGE